KLIKFEGFDPKADWVKFVRPILDNFPFTHWDSRLATLHDLVKSPPPTNSLLSWVERHTSDRNVMTVATLALFLAVIFGIVSTLLGCAQLIVAWLSWRHPVSVLSTG
ncbi:hypothetical protein QBC38DRAFT_375064, partial [Podospora fimiseda]